MLPTIMDLMPSVIKTLKDGEFHTKKEIDSTIASEFGVTESEMKEKLKYGASKFKNRVGWALINLKNKGLILKEGLGYKLTETGKKAASDLPTKVTAKYVKSLSKKDDDDDEGKNTPKSNGGGKKEETQKEVEKVVTEKTEEESAAVETDTEEKEGTPETVTTEADDTVDVSMYKDLDPDCDFVLVMGAKSGDVKASKKLWDKYKDVLTPMFRHCKNLTDDEKRSEAALVFAHKLEYFKPEKINKSPEVWTFSYMLTGGAKNAVDKIIKKSIRDEKKNSMERIKVDRKKGVKKIVEDIQVTEAKEVAKKNYKVFIDVNNLENPGAVIPSELLELNPFEFGEKYNPETTAIKSTTSSLENKETELMKQLSPFQVCILQFRQVGKSIREIADAMNCGVNKINKNLTEAREIASFIFDVNYCR